MVVIPCALGVVGRIAQGQANPVIECVRETSFNLIYLRNMSQAIEAGAVIDPMVPTYYNVPTDG
jgi:flavin prenyltransferase